MTRRQFAATALGAAQARPQRETPPPNILFFFPDQWRYDWTPLHRELPLRLPNLQALMGRGVAFSRAVVASPVCAPSRACLAAGAEYERCGVPSNQYDFPLDRVTYYRLLRDRGYHVAGCGKFDLHKKSYIWGLDGRTHLAEWGFTDGIDNEGKFDAINSGAERPKGPYMAYLHAKGLAATHVADFARRRGIEGYSNTGPTPLSDSDYCDNWVAENGLKLLRAVRRGRPWHLVVNFVGPHNPVDITRTMEKTCRGRTFPQPFGSTQLTPEIHNLLRQNYAAMCENIDRWLGAYLDEVRRRGELDNTLVVFSSDHGEMLGDHNRWGKSVPYQPSVGVPLVLAGPQVQEGRVSEALVSHMDLAATFLDLAGVPVPRDMDSRSLRPLLRGDARTHREVVRSGLGTWRMASDGRYKLIRGFDPAAQRGVPQAGSPEYLLYDLEHDPNEAVNVAEKLPEQVERLKAFLS
jgi:arylsulfatase A-like enzyme